MRRLSSTSSMTRIRLLTIDPAGSRPPPGSRLPAPLHRHWDAARPALDADRHGERERRPLTERGLHPQPAAVHLDDALRDGQAEPGAADLARAGVVDLLELLED